MSEQLDFEPKSVFIVIREDEALAVIAAQLEVLSLLARTHGLDHIADQIEAVG